jgi:1,4-dihydroxy-2-naphthoyl-CoA hydrolase
MPKNMTIWKRPATPAAIESRYADSLPGLLGIRILEIGPDFLRAEMPVDRRHRQPFGVLHGGASVVLSETLGSICGALVLPPGGRCVGIEVNANHLAAVREGETVQAVCRAMHVGRATSVWQTEIRRASDGRLACVSRLTVAVTESGGGVG